MGDRTYGTLEDIKRSRERSKDAEKVAGLIVFLFLLTGLSLLAIVVRIVKYGLEMG